MPSIHLRPGTVLGEVPSMVYGHFTEHLGPIMYDGLWAEKLFGRKFEAPMVARTSGVVPAAPWQAFLERHNRTEYLRNPDGIARVASPQGGAHHAQGVKTVSGVDRAERGLAQSEVAIDNGVEYVFRARLRRVGPAGRLRVALRASDGETVLAEAWVDVPAVTSTRLGHDFPHNFVWMDDQSWTTVETRLTAETDDVHGWLTMTFQPDSAQDCLWMFDWVSLMPSDNVSGWHRGVTEALRDLPAQSLKWPGGCMADDYDWRYGVGPRDSRFGRADQSWAAWDENDVGIDEFIELCRLTGAEPVLGVNGGNGSADLAADLVEYCNGSTDTAWGAMRAANGHPAPYRVRYWVVGNEQWGWFAVGHASPDEYAKRYLRIARAMKTRDPSISLTAVGHVDGFSTKVLRVLQAEGALDLVDMLQIHGYTPDDAASVTDSIGASRKVASARLFDRLLDQCKTEIGDVEGAGHVKVCLDEWGWGRAGHAGAIFMAAAINAFHRAAPLVQIASKAAVINVDGVLERVGHREIRTSAYDIFRVFNVGHLPFAVMADVTGADHDDVDVSALTDPTSGRVTVYLVNRSPSTIHIDMVVEGLDVNATATVTTVCPISSDVAGPSAVRTFETTLKAFNELPPLSLSSIRIGQ